MPLHYKRTPNLHEAMKAAADAINSMNDAVSGFKKTANYKTKKFNDKHFTPVLRHQDIFRPFAANKNEVFIAAPGYEKVKVPEFIFAEIAKMYVSYKTKSNSKFDSMETNIINLCINHAVFYHPVEQLNFVI